MTSLHVRTSCEASVSVREEEAIAELHLAELLTQQTRERRAEQARISCRLLSHSAHVEVDAVQPDDT